MFFAKLNSILPEYYKLRSGFTVRDPVIKYGFTTETKFNFKDDLGTSHGTRKGHFTGNEVNFFGKYKAVIVHDVPIFDGYNANYMDTQGNLDPNLFYEEAQRFVIKKENLQEVFTWARQNCNMSNSVSLFYNLLRMYYIEEYGELSYEPEALFYDDGHITTTNRNIYQGFDKSFKLRESVRYEKTDVTLDAEAYIGRNFENPCYLWDGLFTKAHEEIIAQACGKWEQLAPFGLAHSSSQLASDILINTGLESQTAIQDKRRITRKDLISEVISILIRANRLYTDFDYAYLMICQILVSPRPRSAEACAWVNGNQIINMPMLASLSGYIPMMRSGSPFARRATWEMTYNSWLKEKEMVLFHSIAVVEAASIEMFNLTRTSEHSEVTRDNFYECCVDGVPASYSGVIQDMCLVATRYGHEIDLPYAATCGLTRSSPVGSNLAVRMRVNVTDPEAEKYYNIVTISEDGGVEQVNNQYLEVTNPVAMMYPIMSYGLNPEDYYADYNECTIKASCCSETNRGITFTKLEEYSKFMNVMRMMGYDVKAKDVLNNRIFNNWSDNASGRYVFTDGMSVDDDIIMHVKYTDVKKRDNSWIDLHTITGNVEIAFKMTCFRMAIFNEGRSMQLGGKLLGTIKEVPKMVLPSERQRYLSDSVKIVPLKRQGGSDFRFTRFAIPVTSTSIPGLSRETMLIDSLKEVPDSDTPKIDSDTQP